MIQVTKPTTPKLGSVTKYLKRIHERAWLTNNGPIVQELTDRLREYLGVENLLLTANGTLALQVAYKVFEIESQAITSPFTFIATASAMKWQGINPQFADIDSETLCLSAYSTSQAITEQTQALVPVHVYGNPCEVEEFEKLGRTHNIPVIYDASHAFSVKYQGTSILNWGDAATLSLHATKLFHTIEGGAIIFKNKEHLERAQKMINFGLSENPEDICLPGINAKMSEIHAAYGLCALDSIEQTINRRLEILDLYQSELADLVRFPKWREGATNNAAYAPILLESEKQCSKVLADLKSQGIFARRYFYPSLNTVSQFKQQAHTHCSNAEKAAGRVICLPIYPDLDKKNVQRIVRVVRNALH